MMNIIIIVQNRTKGGRMQDILNTVYYIKKLYSHLCLAVMKKYNLTRSELDILLFLYNNPNFDNAKDIVEKRGLSKSHASMGIEKLVVKGYLNSYQDQKDRRKYHLKLLNASLPIIKDGLEAQKQFGQILFKDFSEEEIKIYLKMYKKICQNIKEEVH